MQFCLENVFFLSTQLDFRLKKNEEKFGAISVLLGKTFVVTIKKMLVIQFSYMEIVL